MVVEVTDPEPKSKFEEIGIQASPSTCDVKTQFSGYTHSHSKGNIIFQLHKHFFYLLFFIVGMQVNIKPECCDVGIQCSLHATTYKKGDYVVRKVTEDATYGRTDIVIVYIAPLLSQVVFGI